MKWKSVIDDGLPSKNGIYLICSEYWSKSINTSLFLGGKFYERDVSHWMELPKPPGGWKGYGYIREE